MNGNYTNQTRRVVRSFSKLPKENYSKNFSEDDWDAYYHFFQDAFHLKDWIINDSGNKITRKKIDEFIKRSGPLKILQSVVNSIKHFKIEDEKHNKYPQIDCVFEKLPKIQYKREDFICQEDGSKILQEDGSAILAESSEEGEVHPKRLAIDVLIEWNKFFKENGFKGHFSIIP